MTYPFRKLHPAWIRIVRQNHRIIECDVWNPAGKMRLCIERSNDLAPLPPFPSWLDCTTNTSGYAFRKGQVLKAPGKASISIVDLFSTRGHGRLSASAPRHQLSVPSPARPEILHSRGGTAGLERAKKP